MVSAKIAGIWRETDRPGDPVTVHFELLGLGDGGKVLRVQIDVRAPDENIAGVVDKARAQFVKQLEDVAKAVGIVMVTPQDVERYKDSHALIIKPALQEGRVMYESA